MNGWGLLGGRAMNCVSLGFATYGQPFIEAGVLRIVRLQPYDEDRDTAIAKIIPELIDAGFPVADCEEISIEVKRREIG